MVIVSSTSVSGPGHGQTTEVYLYNISTSLTGRGHDGHGQFNICHRTWSWTNNWPIPVQQRQLTYSCTANTADLYLYNTSKSVKGRGHDDHVTGRGQGQTTDVHLYNKDNWHVPVHHFNVHQRMWSWWSQSVQCPSHDVVMMVIVRQQFHKGDYPANSHVVLCPKKQQKSKTRMTASVLKQDPNTWKI